MEKHASSLHIQPLIFEGDFKATGGQQAAEMMQTTPFPTAIIAANDLMAMGAMRELRKAGLRVSDDVSVVGFDDILFSALSCSPLTTLALPREEIGRAASEALLQTFNTPDRQGREYNIAPKLVVRESTGAVAVPSARKQR